MAKAAFCHLVWHLVRFTGVVYLRDEMNLAFIAECPAGGFINCVTGCVTGLMMWAVAFSYKSSIKSAGESAGDVVWL